MNHTERMGVLQAVSSLDREFDRSPKKPVGSAIR
jgi:hypothetical protein